MSNKVYVGNMSYDTTEEQLIDLFSQYGEVTEAKIIFDQFTERSKGFGFITFADSQSCADSISALNGQEFGGRTLKVNEAQNKPARTNNSGSRNNRRY
jgi:RNA recognition motif-containing protein